MAGKTLNDGVKKSTTRRIFLVRNSEAAGFGGLRNNNAFQNHNKFAKMDIDQAVMTVIRPDNLENSIEDPPLTQIGRSSAELIGRSLSDRSFHIHTIYSSPSLRCIQVAFITAIALMSTLNYRKLPRFRIEPALFEPFSLCHKIPKFLSPRDLQINGYAFDEHYKSVMSITDLINAFHQELRPSDIQKRVEKIVHRILSGRKQEGGILIISHAPILDVIYRILTNRHDMPRTMGDVQRLIHNYPRCSITVLQYNPMTDFWENQQNAISQPTDWLSSSRVNVPNFD
ncbi:unnamed protein product [Thelazia callipaeda]|uniref:Phosphoglycerate mutase family protein n=1 Tax=Thelazia callipaeda TaxID=103827 RepID=A0A0N5CNL4_THECL|nr:unnamed protein product [Thelazia callipaeda]